MTRVFSKKAGGTLPVQLAALSGTVPATNPNGIGTTWNIQVGSSLVFGPGTNQEETVRVLQVDPLTKSIVAQFANNHAPGTPIHYPENLTTATITVPGNPGPQPNFDHRNFGTNNPNGGAILHYSIIE